MQGERLELFCDSGKPRMSAKRMVNSRASLAANLVGTAGVEMICLGSMDWQCPGVV